MPAADGARTIGYMYLRQSNQKRADGSVLSHLQIAENVWDPVKKRSRVRIPVQPDHRIRRKPITDSDSTRSLIPDEPDHRFRCQADHFFAAAGIVQGVWCEGARGAG